MTTDNVTDMREWEVERLIARDTEAFMEAMRRAPHVVRVVEKEAS